MNWEHFSWQLSDWQAGGLAVLLTAASFSAVYITVTGIDMLLGRINRRRRYR